MSTSNETDRSAQIAKRLEQLDPVTMKVLDEVLRLERQKLHMARPQGIIQDIVDVVKRVIP